MRKIAFIFLVLLLLVSCKEEPQVNYHELATTARVELMSMGLIVSDPVIADGDMHFSIFLVNDSNSSILEDKATQNPMVSFLWTINTTTDEVFHGSVPIDEQKMKDISVIWLSTYLLPQKENINA